MAYIDTATGGTRGWLPNQRLVNIDSRLLIQLVSWQDISGDGSSGTPPTNFINFYMGADGWVEKPENATALPRGNAGTGGWTPIVAFEFSDDGTRNVLAITDYIGGQGEKPPTPRYAGPNGLVTDKADAITYNFGKGDLGHTGWTPLLAFEPTTVANEYVLAITDYIGGQGEKPPTPQYAGPNGLVTDKADARKYELGKGETGDIPEGALTQDNISDTSSDDAPFDKVAENPLNFTKDSGATVTTPILSKDFSPDVQYAGRTLIIQGSFSLNAVSISGFEPFVKLELLNSAGTVQLTSNFEFSPSSVPFSFTLPTSDPYQLNETLTLRLSLIYTTLFLSFRPSFISTSIEYRGTESAFFRNEVTDIANVPLQQGLSGLAEQITEISNQASPSSLTPEQKRKLDLLTLVSVTDTAVVIEGVLYSNRADHSNSVSENFVASGLEAYIRVPTAEATSTSLLYKLNDGDLQHVPPPNGSSIGYFHYEISTSNGDTLAIYKQGTHTDLAEKILEKETEAKTNQNQVEIFEVKESIDQVVKLNPLLEVSADKTATKILTNKAKELFITGIVETDTPTLNKRSIYKGLVSYGRGVAARYNGVDVITRESNGLILHQNVPASSVPRTRTEYVSQNGGKGAAANDPIVITAGRVINGVSTPASSTLSITQNLPENNETVNFQIHGEINGRSTSTISIALTFGNQVAQSHHFIRADGFDTGVTVSFKYNPNNSQIYVELNVQYLGHNNLAINASRWFILGTYTEDYNDNVAASVQDYVIAYAGLDGPLHLVFSAKASATNTLVLTAQAVSPNSYLDEIDTNVPILVDEEFSLSFAHENYDITPSSVVDSALIRYLLANYDQLDFGLLEVEDHPDNNIDFRGTVRTVQPDGSFKEVGGEVVYTELWSGNENIIGNSFSPIELKAPVTDFSFIGMVSESDKSSGPGKLKEMKVVPTNNFIYQANEAGQVTACFMPGNEGVILINFTDPTHFYLSVIMGVPRLRQIVGFPFIQA